MSAEHYLPLKHNKEAGCIEDCKGRMIADIGFWGISPIDMGDYICLAANNHDALVEACKEAKIILEIYPGRFCKLALEMTDRVLSQIEKEK